MFKSVTFEVIGDQRLVCEGCEERVEHALKSLDGVNRVRVKASNQSIDVLFDSAKLEPSSIVEQIAKVGYQAKVAS